MNDDRHLEAILRIRCGISFRLAIDDKRSEEEQEKESKTTKEMKKKVTQITSKWTKI